MPVGMIKHLMIGNNNNQVSGQRTCVRVFIIAGQPLRYPFLDKHVGQSMVIMTMYCAGVKIMRLTGY
jgi:hypothetical protein